ncbi:efflux transporter outer membrane subunit [Marinobacterium sp. YM272]|uniref:efflux transporter outer membrane subunit n=1 Tax=Marinobacterium sp. YM272 TaxID=3421654 RepID=UPI003D7FF71B
MNLALNRPISGTSGRLLLAGLAVAFALAGCASPKGIHPQAALTQPEAVEGVSHPAANSDNWPSIRWWQSFADPQLDKLVEQAMLDNPTLEAAAARIRRAQAQAGRTLSPSAPQLNANINANIHGWPTDDHYGSGTLAGTETWDNSAMLGFSYELDLFGRQQDRKQRAQRDVAVSEASARVVQLDLTANLIRTYIAYALNYAQLDVQKSRLAQQHQIVDLTQKQLSAGIGTRYDLQQARAQLPVTQRRIRALEEAIELNRNTLVTLAAQPLSEAGKLVRPTLLLNRQLSLPSDLPLELIGRRPDLVLSRWQIASQASAVDMARTDFYPNINLVASLGQVLTNGALTDWTDAERRTFSAGPALSLPIFDGGARRARLGIAAAEYDEAVQQYNNTLRHALQEVSDQLIRQRSAKDQSELADLAVQQAEQVYDTAEKAFQRGLTDYLHVLDAQTRLLDQRIAREQIHAQLLRVQADLALSLGGGVQFMAQPDNEQLTPERVPVSAEVSTP